MALNPAIPSLFLELIVMDKDSSAALHERVAASMNREKTARSRSIISGDRAKTVNDNTPPFLLFSCCLLLLDERATRGACALIAFPIPPFCCGRDRCEDSRHWLRRETRLSGGGRRHQC